MSKNEVDAIAFGQGSDAGATKKSVAFIYAINAPHDSSTFVNRFLTKSSRQNVSRALCFFLHLEVTKSR